MKSNADVQSDLTSCPICGPGPYHPPYTICAECLPLVSPPIAEGDDRRHTPLTRTSNLPPPEPRPLKLSRHLRENTTLSVCTVVKTRLTTSQNR